MSATEYTNSKPGQTHGFGVATEEEEIRSKYHEENLGPQGVKAAGAGDKRRTTG